MADWYKRGVESVLAELKVQPARGLSSEEAEHRLHQYGINELRKQKSASAVKIFLEQFASPLIGILIVATILSAALKEFVDAGVILAIVILNALLGFAQEYNAERAIEALQKLTAPNAKVVRNGHITEIKSRDLVPGDIILVETGDKIPADARIIESTNLETQEAVLTGESLPNTKSTETLNKDTVVADQTNMLFAGTIVTRGRAKAVVTETAMKTQFGDIATLIQEEKKESTPLQKQFAQIARFMSIIAVIIIIVTFALGALRGQPLVTMFLVAVSLAVAAVPEGLPAVITIALALGVQRMAKHNALIRKLSSAETLGSVTVICSDKTGTLTHNEMTVRRIWVNDQTMDVTGSGYDRKGFFYANSERIELKKNSELQLMLKIGMLCNNANTSQQNGRTTIIGDPTEGALLISGEKAEFDIDELNATYPRLGEIEFTSERKRMTTIHKMNDKKVALAKGAPDVLLKYCDRVMVNGRAERMTKEKKQEILKANEIFAEQAMRVIGFAYKNNLPATTKLADVEKEMIFIGLQAMIDPARDGVREAIKKCKSASIRVVMITGDHKTTACAIAKEIGIEGEAITGEELDAMSKDELQRRIEAIGIFSRVDPKHKLKIIEALKAKDHVVAMTGDGVNDAPALKKADIGIAMGITGTDVSKEASDMILADDNFSSIVEAVEQGRGVYDNIRKFFAFLFSGNIGEVGIILLAILMGLPLPLTAVLILLINLVTDGLPAIALSADPFEPNAMKTKPRNIHEPIHKGLNAFFIGYPIIMIAAVLGLFMFALWRSGNPALSFFDPEFWRSGNIIQAQTIAFLTMAMFEMFQAFAARSTYLPSLRVGLFKNKLLVSAVLVSLIVCLSVIYVPFLQSIFKTTALSIAEIMIIVGISSIGFIYLEIHKWMTSKRAGWQLQK